MMIRIPLATYRIQFRPEFGFDKCKEILVYLKELGVSDIYASPIFRARKGSEHGYDICDHDEINPELGGEEGLSALTEERRAVDIGWVQDIVPNHMAFSPENTKLVDLLENGPHSRYYNFFDINWDHHDSAMKGRVLAPFLGGFYGETLEKGELTLDYNEQGFVINYYEFQWPINIESYGTILSQKIKSLSRRLGRDDPDFVKLLGTLYIIRTLAAAEDRTEQYDQISFVKRMLNELHVSNEVFREYIQATLDLFNGYSSTGTGDRFELLDSLLDEQFYRLSYWKVAADEINYRRFFSINELISLRVEQPDVCELINRLALQKYEEGVFTGLRVDHVDGLFDPAKYLADLRSSAQESYLLVEKILELEENLPDYLPIQGTTGYDFLNYVNLIQCAHENAETFTRIYKGATGVIEDFKTIVHSKKRLIIEEEMAGDVFNLAHIFKRLSDKDRHGKDITLYGLHRALMEALALFPVYRSYINKESFTDQDRSYITEAVDKAIRKYPALTNELSFIKRFLLLEFPDYFPEEEKGEWIDLAMRFQQLTGPLMAKGFEDTSLYVYNRLISLNEVGSDPSIFGRSQEQFHQYISTRHSRWPYSMNSTATHDTKRGEDVRCRINVLSEIPEQWRSRVERWTTINAPHKTFLDDGEAPDRNDEYFYYQTLIGAFPLNDEEYPDFINRIKQYAIKAVREAKVHTAWLKPDTEYEEAFMDFIDKTLSTDETNEFLKDIKEFQSIISHYGMINSLGQALLKIACPGVPDIYQGTEIWDLSLVDPDNRRPVDFGLRSRLLKHLKSSASENLGGLIKDLLDRSQDPGLKLFTIHKALEARRDHREVFQNGSYIPLVSGGAKKDNVLAFFRNHGTQWALTLIPRFPTSICDEYQWPLGKDCWMDTSIGLPDDDSIEMKNIFTGKELRANQTLLVGDVLSEFPVALLVGASGE